MKKPYYQQSIESILTDLDSTLHHGLTQENVLKKQKMYGLNTLPSQKEDSYILLFLRQLNTPFMYLLGFAAILKYIMESFLDTSVIVIIMLVNALFGAFQEGRSQKILKSLYRLIQFDCIVVRNGEKTIIPHSEIVPGDIIILQEGVRVPADARIVQSFNLMVDESMLTGESLSVEKYPDDLEPDNLPPHDQHTMIFAGTHILSGSGVALVVATGLNTEIGKLKKNTESLSTDMPLQRDMARLSRLIMLYSVVISLALFFVGLLLGKNIEELVFTLSSLFVSVVPESLPVITLVVLASGAYRMSLSNVLIKKLPAIEALGRIQALVVDKTGTLTRNEQMVSLVFTDNHYYDVTGNGYHTQGHVFLEKTPIIDPQPKSPLWYIGIASTLINRSVLSYDENRKVFALKGEPIHAALGVFAKKLGFDSIQLKTQFHFIDESPFNVKNRSNVIWYESENMYYMFVTGAPEYLLSSLHLESQTLHDALNFMLHKKLRNIAFAYKIYAPHAHEQEKNKYDNLIFLGFIGMQDALRENLPSIVTELKKLDVHVIMATGDHKQTALYVATEAGIFKEGDTALEGNDLNMMSREEIAQALTTTTVLARVTPEEKILIVTGFHDTNKIVGMTGDGVNDAPALSAADVGIAMGAGTEVSKEVADVVLLDDSLASIAAGIKEGRNVLETLHRVIFYLFTTGATEFFVIVISMVTQLPLPLLATQILWVNIVTDGFLDIGLCFEPQESSSFDFKATDSILFSGNKIITLLLIAGLMTTGTLLQFIRYYTINLDLARTMTLVTLAMFQWFNAWNLRSLKKSIFTIGLFSNRPFFSITLLVISLQLFAIYNSFMQKALHTVPLTLYQGLECFLIASTLLIIVELYKYTQHKKTA